MDDVIWPLAERKTLQHEYGTTQLPLQDLCYCTYTTTTGEQIIADVIGTDESEQIALLSYFEVKSQERGIWIAERDQNGRPGTWRWTQEQLDQARTNPVRIDERENEFEDEYNGRPIEVAPIHPDRRTEILMLGGLLKKTPDEVRERLRAEGFDTTLPPEYERRLRANAGAQEKGTEPLLRASKPKFSGNSRRKWRRR